MKPQLFNTEITPAMQLLFVRLKAVTNTKSLKRHTESWRKVQFLGNDTHEPCEFYTLGSPPEHVVSAFVAGHTGKSAMLNELIQEGYVKGFFSDLVRVCHELSLRDAAWLGQRESVANSAIADGREAAVANALDPSDAIDFSESADGWFKISPYGTFPGKIPGREQHVSLDNAKAMESEFNSLLGKLGRKFRGVPIYHGHPDVDPTIWTDDRRLGKITQLEARADGLWGFAEWNSIGEQNKAEGWWIYPSPRWDAPVGGKKFSPDRLMSIGLTNTPRIVESDPVFNSQLQTNPTIMDPKLIREKLGLAPEATDEEVFAKIESLTTAANSEETAATELENAKTALDAEKKAKDEMACSITVKDSEITSLREAHNNSILDLAIRDGRITQADRPTWQARLASGNREQEINSLAAIAPKLNGKQLDLADRRADRAAGDDLREQVANSVAKLQRDEGLSYDAAWRKTKKDPAFKAYFERAEG